MWEGLPFVLDKELTLAGRHELDQVTVGYQYAKSSASMKLKSNYDELNLNLVFPNVGTAHFWIPLSSPEPDIPPPPWRINEATRDRGNQKQCTGFAATVSATFVSLTRVGGYTLNQILAVCRSED